MSSRLHTRDAEKLVYLSSHTNSSYRISCLHCNLRVRVFETYGTKIVHSKFPRFITTNQIFDTVADPLFNGTASAFIMGNAKTQVTITCRPAYSIRKLNARRIETKKCVFNEAYITRRSVRIVSVFNAKTIIPTAMNSGAPICAMWTQRSRRYLGLFSAMCALT